MFRLFLTKPSGSVPTSLVIIPAPGAALDMPCICLDYAMESLALLALRFINCVPS